MSRKIPNWSVRVQKKMIERGMKKIELARELKVNEKQLYSVMTGGVINDNMSKMICDYFGIER